MLETKQLLPHDFLNRGDGYSWSFQHGYNIVVAHFQFHMRTASKASWLQSAENNSIVVLSSVLGCFVRSLNILGGTEHCHICAGEIENIHQVN